MLRKIVLTSILFLVNSISIVFGQDTTVFKRGSYKLKIAVDKKNIYTENIKETPFVLPDKTIQLYPFEKIYVEVIENHGIIGDIRAIKKIQDSSKTLIIELKQISKNNVHQETMLVIKNPFNYDLYYNANIFLLNQRKWVNTSVLPIEAKISGIETWPDVIISIYLYNFKFGNVSK